ncbi:hypothetical protein ACA910_019996 [Epithemia clementina (nom. ined.)]
MSTSTEQVLVAEIQNEAQPKAAEAEGSGDPSTKEAAGDEKKETAPASNRGRPEWRSLSKRSRSSSQGAKKGTTKNPSVPARSASQRVNSNSSKKKEPTLGEFLAASSADAGGARSSSSNASNNKIVRKTSFKKIRGIFTGGSRRSRRNLKAASKSIQKAEAPDQRPDNPDDDASTINVNVDDRSVANSTVASSRKLDANEAYLLRMVLLLMDVGSRRFELLQLEFDSEKALVSDVLSQIPVSVTEESLRGQQYEAIVTTDGKDMEAGKRLADFCQGNDVLVAVPKGLEPSEAHRLAKPILSNAKVVGMLKSSGVDVQAMQTGKTRVLLEPEKKESTQMDDRKISDWSSRHMSSGKGDPTKKPVQMGGTLVFVGLVLAMAALVASLVHKYITTPLQPGQVVSPGIVLSKCGLKFFSDCERAYLEVQSGKVSYYRGNELAWVIHGRVCPEEEVKNKACLDGLEFKKDRTLWLGGEPIKWLERHSETGQRASNAEYLVPWPFSEEPKIKSWEIAANKVKSGAVHFADDAKKAAGKIKEDATHFADDAKKAAGKIKEDAKRAAGGFIDEAREAAGKIKEGATGHRKMSQQQDSIGERGILRDKRNNSKNDDERLPPSPFT